MPSLILDLTPLCFIEQTSDYWHNGYSGHCLVRYQAQPSVITVQALLAEAEKLPRDENKFIVHVAGPLPATASAYAVTVASFKVFS
jgi:hypothetical protein